MDACSKHHAMETYGGVKLKLHAFLRQYYMYMNAHLHATVSLAPSLYEAGQIAESVG